MRPFLILAVATALLAGCGSSSSTSTTTQAPASTAPAPSAKTGPEAVTIADFKYHPAALTVTAGTKVTFTNKDSAPHTATATGLDTGTLQQGGSKTLVLSKPGTYAYVCSFHPYMHGSIVVR
jgi:plastocyanin